MLVVVVGWWFFLIRNFVSTYFVYFSFGYRGYIQLVFLTVTRLSLLFVVVVDVVVVFNVLMLFLFIFIILCVWIFVLALALALHLDQPSHFNLRALSFSLISSRFVSFVLFPFWIERYFTVLIRMLKIYIIYTHISVRCACVCFSARLLNSLPVHWLYSPLSPLSLSLSHTLWLLFFIFLNSRIIKKRWKRRDPPSA